MAGIRITSAVRKTYDQLRSAPGATGSGVAAQKRGYHNSRSNNPSYDYSVKLSLDKQGPSDAAAAIDITCSTRDMIMYTKRAMAAMDRNDPNFASVREFIGTVDGNNVVRYTRTSRTGSPSWASSDSSHLWHYHISLFRADLENYDRLSGIVDVLLDGSTGSASDGEGIFDVLDLKKGDSGRQVVLLQTFLHSAGFSPGDIDGDYGPATAASVLEMRKSTGSSAADGDKMTPWAVVQLDIAMGNKHQPAAGDTNSAPADHTHPAPDVEGFLPVYGDTGRTVGYWQRLLRADGETLDITSEYDDQTTAAVQSWFSKHSDEPWHGRFITSWIAEHLQGAVYAKDAKLTGELKITNLEIKQS